MEINPNAEAVRSFIGNTKDKDGNEYIIKVVVFKEPIVTESSFGNIKSGAFIQRPNSEIIFPMLFPEELNDEQMHKQGNYMSMHIDDILKDIQNG